MNALLFIGCVLCWGSTWVAIPFQSQTIGIEPGIAWRFFIAGSLLWLYLKLRGQWKTLSPTQVRWCILQSFFISGLNFVFFYHGIQYISSGMAALIFAIAPLINSINSYIFYKQPTRKTQIVGALIGLVGLSMIVLDSADQYGLADLLTGVGLCVLGTICFSLANMIAIRLHQQHVSPMISNTWAMACGGVFLFIYSLVSGQVIIPEFSVDFVWSTLYLAIIGSVLGFTFYFKLLGNVGSTKAAYVALVSPVVAAVLATIFEGWLISLITWLGIALVLFGNWVGLREWSAKHAK